MKKSFYSILFLLLFIFCQFSLYGQINIDSLKTSIDNSKIPSEKISKSLDLINILLKNGNSETLKYLGLAAELLGEYPDSLGEVRLNNYYARYYVLIGQYNRATEYFLSAIKKSKKINNSLELGRALNGLAQLNIRIGNYKKGISIFNDLLENARKNDNEENLVFYSINLAMANGEAGNLDEAEKYLLDVYKSNPKNIFYKAVAANSLSFIYNNTKKYDKAYKYAKAAQRLSTDNPDVDFKIEILTNYSNALKGLGRNEEAGKLMFRILELARKNNYVRKANNEVGNIALNYADMGKYEPAYRYYKKFSEQRDSLLNESTNSKIQELQIKYETEKKDKELTEKNSALREQKLFLTYSILGIILLILVVAVISFLYKDKNRAYKELVRKNLEIIKKEENYIKGSKAGNEEGKYISSSLSDKKKENLNQKLKEKILEEKVYLNSELSLGKLAQKLDVNSKYLSQLIHEYYNSNFSDFINKQRINEAVRLLSNNSYRHISMEGISEMVGFHTKSSFNIYFKKFMGVTPSFFVKNYEEASKL